MRVNHRYAGAVLLVVLAGPMARALEPANPTFLATPVASAKPAAMPPLDPTPSLAPYAPDAWMYQQQPHPQPNCCGPIGGNGPIGSEVYVRTGPSFVISGSDFARSLRTGWEVMGGGKSLFFHGDGDRAWVVDLGLSYTYNDGRPASVFTVNGELVTVRNLHRTAVSLGLGHDWFLFGPGYVGGSFDSNFRFGMDAGGRWGTSHVDLNPVAEVNGYRRDHDVFGAVFAGMHCNWEVPMGAWTFLAGVRGEWSYSFMDLAGLTSSGLHDINVLLTAGVRY